MSTRTPMPRGDATRPARAPAAGFAPALAAALLVLAGCGDRAGEGSPRSPAGPDADPGGPVADATGTRDREPLDPRPLDQPDEDVPPATAPPGVAIPRPGLPAEGTVGFEGFGPAAFGDPGEAVRQAWGGALEALPGADAHCHYLSPPVEPDTGYQVAFMVEDGRFVRIDIASDRVAAPGGGRIGMDEGEIADLYPGRIERRPHKYVEGGVYLRIGDPDGGPAVLLFEVDADGEVTEWRVGIPPQVDYVEGCA